MKEMRRRAISDVIATLLLLGITVAGAVLVTAFFQGNSVFRHDASNPGTQSASIKIIGYDTRDSTDLSGIDFLDNYLDSPTPFLCTISCNTDADALPDAAAAGGTEFIVLTVRNQGISKVTLQGVEINDIDHSWDSTTSTFDLSATHYPTAGKFSIISTSGTIQSSTNELQRNAEARLVIKLSDNISEDIDVNQPIRTRITTNLLDPSASIITSGGVR